MSYEHRFQRLLPRYISRQVRGRHGDWRTRHMEIEQFAEIVRRHQAGVCAVAYGVTGDRALSEDIAQDTFLAAWRGAQALRDPSRLRGWLHGIARNLARKARRRRRPVALGDGGEIAAPGDPAGEAMARDEERVAWAALRALPA